MIKLLKRYERIFQEIENERYQSFTVYDYFIAGKRPPTDKVSVILRFDVDCNLYFAYQAALHLKERKITASFYFLPSTEQYNIWENELVKKISQLGFEVGLHSDHYSRQVRFGIDGIAAIKEEVNRFSSLLGKPPEGMVYHVGEDGIESWHLYKYVEPKELGLKYHDGFASKYHDTRFNFFHSTSDYMMSDYYYFSNGWRLRPFMVRSKLKKANKGESIHITIHPTFMFKWWKAWQDEYGKKKPPRKWFVAIIIKFFRRLGFSGMAVVLLQLLVTFFQLMGKIIFRKTEEDKRAYIYKTSFNGERDSISLKEKSLWEDKIKEFKLVANKRVLDLGCGIGQWSVALSYHNKKVIAVDPCFKSLTLARENLKIHKIHNSFIGKAQGEALPFQNSTFDSVFCYGVLMYAREFSTIAEIARVLKKGGRVLLAIDGPGYFLKNIVDGIKYSHPDSIKLGLIALVNTLMRKYVLKRENNLASFFTPREMKSLFRKYDLKPQHISPELLTEDMPTKYLGFPFFFTIIGEKL
jgi:ubiquinone/menaquinone biosynthesis C-methylase UbiE